MVTLALANSEEPDVSAYVDDEIVYTIKKPRHVGFIFHSKKQERMDELLSVHSQRLRADFVTSAPVNERHDD